MSRKNGEAAVSTHRCALSSVGYPPPVTRMMLASEASKPYELSLNRLFCIRSKFVGCRSEVWCVVVYNQREGGYVYVL
jgi:hypothetical protein